MLYQILNFKSFEQERNLLANLNMSSFLEVWQNTKRMAYSRDQGSF